MYSRNHFYFAAALMLLAACQSKEISIIPDEVNDGQKVEERVPAPDITAVQEVGNNTKSTLDVDGEGFGTIYWTPADEINVFYGTTSTHYISQNAVNATTAVFTTTDIIGSSEGASENIWGLYPYNSTATCTGSAVTTTLPATQYGVPGTFDDDLYITLAHNNSTALTFYNVCGGIKFSLSRDNITSITFSGNNNEDIAGDISLAFSEGLPTVSVTSGVKEITLTPKAGGTFASGEYYYIIALPTTLSSGFTMTFETDTEIGTFNYTAKAVTIKRSVFSKKNGIDGFASFVAKSVVTNLSASGTANCYIVSSAGDYKFNASVKGNSNESIGSPASASVLWESYGTSVSPSVGDLVNSVSLNEGYVYFTATEAKGNALIAVKDSGGNILWSWHIWCTDTPSEQEYKSDAGIMMDRNIGATDAAIRSSNSCGLLFQWGRKDPMMGLSPLQWDYSTTQYTGEQIDVVQSNETVGTILYSIQHPTTFISASSPVTNYDWYYTGSKTCDNTRWSSVKTIYDPCPVGWRVPDGIGSSVWEKANGSTTFVSGNFTFYSYSSPNMSGVDCTSRFDKTGSNPIWYPLAGEARPTNNPYNNRLTSGRSSGCYWTCTPLDADAYGYYNCSVIHFGTSYINLFDGFRYCAYSVRCQKQ